MIEVALRTVFCFCFFFFFLRSNSYLHQCWFLMNFSNQFRKCRKQRIKDVQIVEEKKIDIFFSPLTRIARGSRQVMRSGTGLEVL